MFTPVITSRKAKDHLEMVKGNYSNIIQGMANQSMKVAQYNQQMDNESKEKIALDNETNQNNVLNMQKQQELELKRMALMTE